MCGWVMECQERGLITKEQLGFELKWGDIKGADRLIQLISRRQGFGNLLGEGVKRAAEKLGGQAKTRPSTPRSAPRRVATTTGRAGTRCSTPARARPAPSRAASGAAGRAGAADPDQSVQR